MLTSNGISRACIKLNAAYLLLCVIMNIPCIDCQPVKSPASNITESGPSGNSVATVIQYTTNRSTRERIFSIRLPLQECVSRNETLASNDQGESTQTNQVTTQKSIPSQPASAQTSTNSSQPSSDQNYDEVAILYLYSYIILAQHFYGSASYM